jgi:hypothetical protein
MAATTVESAVTWGRLVFKCGLCRQSETLVFRKPRERSKPKSVAVLAAKDGQRAPI